MPASEASTWTKTHQIEPVVVRGIKYDYGRLASQLAGLVIAGGSPGTRTMNVRITRSALCGV